MNPIIGKRVILFPLVPEELEHFVKMHKEDKNGTMCYLSLSKMTDEEAIISILHMLKTSQILVFSVMTKEGKASRKAGYVYLSDFTEHSASVSGLMDRDFARGLIKHLRLNKHTFSQDALHTILKLCFEELCLERIEASTFEANKIVCALLNKEGFQREGILRHAMRIDDVFRNVAVFSLLRQEWELKHGEDKKAGLWACDDSHAETAGRELCLSVG